MMRVYRGDSDGEHEEEEVTEDEEELDQAELEVLLYSQLHYESVPDSLPQASTPLSQTVTDSFVFSVEEASVCDTSTNMDSCDGTASSHGDNTGDSGAPCVDPSKDAVTEEFISLLSTDDEDHRMRDASVKSDNSQVLERSQGHISVSDSSLNDMRMHVTVSTQSEDSESDQDDSDSESVDSVKTTSGSSVSEDDSDEEESSLMLNIMGASYHKKSLRKPSSSGAHSDIQISESTNLEDVPDLTLEMVHDSLPDDSWEIKQVDNLRECTHLLPRYYQPITVRCHNCKERGHLSKHCPQPKKCLVCCLCGLEGHLMRSCPNAFCQSCDRPRHKNDFCGQLRKTRLRNKCLRCGRKGHPTHCKTGQLVKGTGEVNKNRSCYNCASKGHFGYDCRKERFTRNIMAPSLFIRCYYLPEYPMPIPACDLRFGKFNQRSKKVIGGCMLDLTGNQALVQYPNQKRKNQKKKASFDKEGQQINVAQNERKRKNLKGKNQNGKKKRRSGELTQESASNSTGEEKDLRIQRTIYQNVPKKKIRLEGTAWDAKSLRSQYPAQPRWSQKWQGVHENLETMKAEKKRRTETQRKNRWKGFVEQCIADSPPKGEADHSKRSRSPHQGQKSGSRPRPPYQGEKKPGSRSPHQRKKPAGQPSVEQDQSRQNGGRFGQALSSDSQDRSRSRENLPGRNQSNDNLDRSRSWESHSRRPHSNGGWNSRGSFTSKRGFRGGKRGRT